LPLRTRLASGSEPQQPLPSPSWLAPWGILDGFWGVSCIPPKHPRNPAKTGKITPFLGFDHGVGHPLLFLCDAKVPNYRKNKGFKVLGPYAEWPKVADAVIKALFCALPLLAPCEQPRREPS
jgi:hypothetical protein